eukprot:s3641_g1.t1
MFACIIACRHFHRIAFIGSPCYSKVCTTASSVKSCILSFVEATHKLSQLPRPGAKLDGCDIAKCIEFAEKQYPRAANFSPQAELEFVTTCLRGILLTFKTTAIAVLDEVDLILHPLMSELNFPVGPRLPLELSPERWELPVHLLQVFVRDKESLRRLGPAAKACFEAINVGIHRLALRDNPHLILAVDDFYFEHLEEPLRAWLCEYLKNHTATKSLGHAEVMKALQEKPAAPRGGKVEELLALGREWLKHLLPFVLGKVNRVHYGLLRRKDVLDLTTRGFVPTGTRLQMAVPFTGLETPSLASEFANPDVAIGLTILAFGYEGMRFSDVKAMLLLLKSELLRDAATPPPQRDAFRRFQDWTSADVDSVDADADPNDPSAGAGTVLPLDLVQPDAPTVRNLKRLWRQRPQVYLFYLTKDIFPKATPTQVKKFSACAQELASPNIFKVRLGFSGTPSNILPSTMPPVSFDDTDGQTMAILSSPQVVSLHCLASGWTPRTLLNFVATRQLRGVPGQYTAFCALIDTGALLCGLENEEVAKLLMDGPLKEAKDAIVFLARGTDLPMILLKGATQAVPLEDANIRPERRFCYFDQPHTTGIDIQQPPLGVAAITVGKDMSIRELQQGAWRMRGLARGQGCEMLLPEEVAVYMRTVHLKDPKALNVKSYMKSYMKSLGESGESQGDRDERLLGRDGRDVGKDSRDEKALGEASAGEALRDIQAALLLKSLELEELQARQLVRQDLLSSWKDESLAALLAGNNGKDPKDPDKHSDKHLQDAGGTAKAAMSIEASVACLLESVPTGLASSESRTLEASLRDLASPFAKTSSVCAAVDLAVKRGIQMLGTSSTSGSCTGEIVREQEEQQQQEHQIESEEHVAVDRPRIGETRYWELEKLQRLVLSHDGAGSDSASLFAFPTLAKVAEIVIGIAGSASNAARKNPMLETLAEAGLRFSPNSRFTTEVPILRPVLVAVQLRHGNDSSALALSPSEAESARWALENFGAPKSSRSGEPIQFCLHIVSEAPTFDASAFHKKVICSNTDIQLLSAPICLLRFYLGDSWFSPQELKCLQSTIGNHKQDFRRLRAGIFNARRQGGAADWSGTPLATVLGDGGATEPVSLQPPGPTFLERFTTEALAGGKDFVETYARNGGDDLKAVLEE